MFGLKDSFCQSCGIPMSKDPKGGGCERNGLLNTEYCSYCCEDGAFTNPGMTVEQMVELVESKFIEMHIPSFLAGPMTEGIPKLKRRAKT